MESYVQALHWLLMQPSVSYITDFYFIVMNKIHFFCEMQKKGTIEQ